MGAPQQIVEKEYSIDAILKELAAIQRQGPKNYCILGTRHCTFLHQQIIEVRVLTPGMIPLCSLCCVSCAQDACGLPYA